MVTMTCCKCLRFIWDSLTKIKTLHQKDRIIVFLSFFKHDHGHWGQYCNLHKHKIHKSTACTSKLNAHCCWYDEIEQIIDV